MKKKIKLMEILNINSVIKAIIDNERLEVSPLLKFKLLGIMKSFEPYIMNYETVKNDAIRKYGKTDDKGNIEVSPHDDELWKAFMEEMNPIINSEEAVELTPLKPEEIFNSGVPSDYLMKLYSVIGKSKERR